MLSPVSDGERLGRSTRPGGGRAGSLGAASSLVRSLYSVFGQWKAIGKF